MPGKPRFTVVIWTTRSGFCSVKIRTSNRIVTGRPCCMVRRRGRPKPHPQSPQTKPRAGPLRSGPDPPRAPASRGIHRRFSVGLPPRHQRRPFRRGRRGAPNSGELRGVARAQDGRVRRAHGHGGRIRGRCRPERRRLRSPCPRGACRCTWSWDGCRMPNCGARAERRPTGRSCCRS